MLLLKEITCPASQKQGNKSCWISTDLNLRKSYCIQTFYITSWVCGAPNLIIFDEPFQMNYVKRHWYPEEPHLAMGFPNHFLFPYIQAWWDLTGVPFTDVTTSSAFPLGKTHPGGHTWRVKPLKSWSIPRTIPPPKNRTKRQVHRKNTRYRGISEMNRIWKPSVLGSSRWFLGVYPSWISPGSSRQHDTPSSPDHQKLLGTSSRKCRLYPQVL